MRVSGGGWGLDCGGRVSSAGIIALSDHISNRGVGVGYRPAPASLGSFLIQTTADSFSCSFSHSATFILSFTFSSLIYSLLLCLLSLALSLPRRPLHPCSRYIDICSLWHWCIVVSATCNRYYVKSCYTATISKIGSDNLNWGCKQDTELLIECGMHGSRFKIYIFKSMGSVRFSVLNGIYIYIFFFIKDAFRWQQRHA